jgi:very-short-patch-repair endonuclease
MTPTESVLWRILRSRPIRDAKWRRQHPIDRFIVDYYCAEQRLIVELDGAIHDTQRERDVERTKLLEQRGYRVLRVRNDELERDPAAVLDRIEAAFR